MSRMSAGNSFQASGAALENDLDPKVVRERGMSWSGLVELIADVIGLVDVRLAQPCRPHTLERVHAQLHASGSTVYKWYADELVAM